MHTRTFFRTLLMVIAGILIAPRLVMAAVVYVDFGGGIDVEAPNYNYNFDPSDNPQAGTFNNYNGPVTFDVGDIFVGGSGGWQFMDNGYDIALLSINDAIDGSSSWDTAAGIGAHTIGETYFYGLRNGGSYGWLEVVRNAAWSFTLLGLGYNENGTILAGETGSQEGGGSAVPEPRVALMMCIGLAFLLRYRTARKHKG
jgi:hypothetical protein